MVFHKKYLFKKAAVLGTGLLGASMALALKEGELVGRVVGSAKTKESMETALKMGAIDVAEPDIRKAVNGADLVILATPVNTIIKHMTLIQKSLKRGCIITDVGSTKETIVLEAQNALPSSVLFVGSHPLAGSEKRGAENARADLFANSTCVMTPVESTNRLAKDKIKHLWSCLGAKVKMMTPKEHDEMVGYISHLPHLVAYALMASVPDEFLEYAAAGLKDSTRVAASSPDIWKDICLSNQMYILKSLDAFVKTTGDYRKAIVSKDENGLQQNFKKAKSKRDALDC